MSTKDPVYGRYRPIKDISVADCLAMYNLFIRYYDNTPLDTFVRDMSRKTGAFMIYRKADDSIVGFSTMTDFEVVADGKKVRCYFSGDTVVDRKYWGTSALRISVFLYALRQKLLRPFQPLYWYLISMGYRTYMVMANNFPNYYPCVEGDDPHLRNIAVEATKYLFPGMLDEKQMMIHFGEDACKLKGDVTPITPADRANPKIAFFEKRNPNWMHGDEMPCIGAVDGAFMWNIISQAHDKLFHMNYKKRAAERAAKAAAAHAQHGHAPAQPQHAQKAQAHVEVETEELREAR